VKSNDIEKRLERAFSAAAPDDFDSVLRDCSEQKGNVIVMTEKTKTARWARFAAAAAVIVFMTAGIFGAAAYRVNYAVDSMISLDVNPSIQITVNQKERVLDVTPLNDDAAVVTGQMDFKGSSLDVTVNALIGSMLRNGYLSDAANSILVSVDGRSADRNAALQERITREIDTIMRDDLLPGSVLGQTIENSDSLTALAEEYGITKGKAQFISRIIDKNDKYAFDELAGLTVNELNLIASSAAQKPEEITATGSASDKKYVGEEAAIKAAADHAGLKPSEMEIIKCEYDIEDGVMVYEVEFVSGGYEYEYDIDALTGKVLKSDKELDDDTQAAQAAVQTGASAEKPEKLIGEAAAKAAALGHAGLREGDVSGLKCRLGREDDVMVYEVEFVSGGYEYEYDIDALTGKVLKSDKELDDDAQTAQAAVRTGASAEKPEKLIGEAAAKAAALGHAGLREGDVSGLKCRLDREDGVMVYEIEFVSGGYEYEYDIDALTGKVLKDEKELDD